MGLDLVELVIATEETFNIEFDDKNELAQIRTVGEYYELILKKLGNIKKTECESNIIFYRIRKAIIEITGLKKKDIKPTSNITEIFGKTDIKNEWKALEEKTDFRLPSLQIRDSIRNSIIIVNIIITVVFVIGITFFQQYLCFLQEQFTR